MSEEEKVEKNIPEFLKSRLDLKAATISNFIGAINSLKKPNPDIPFTLSTNTKVILLTNFGTVEGDFSPLTNNDTEPDVAGLLSELIFDARNEALYEDEKDIKIVTNNFSTITIVNAKVVPYANPNSFSNYKVLNIFTDQIIGFTFGEK